MAEEQRVVIDVAAVRAKARRDWERSQRQTLSVQERIGQSVPWWLVAVAFVFFVLSAPHTAKVFGMLTPVFGYVAPVGVEFGLLYAAFRRKQSKAAGLVVPWTLWALEVLLFVTAMVVNGAGSLQAVVSATESIQDKSFGALLAEFPGLPATGQVALLLVPLAALIIPIGTSVAGEGLATLFLERRELVNDSDSRWREVSAEVEYYALRDAALARGVSPSRANKWAASITGAGLSAVSVSTGQERADRTEDRTDERSNGHGTGRGYGKRMDARTVAREYLAQHPEAMNLPSRDVARLAGIGKSVMADEIKRVRTNGNGHGGMDE